MGHSNDGGFVEVEFRVADDAYPANRVSRELDCRLDLLDAVKTDAGDTTAFFHVDGADPDAVLAEARAAPKGGAVSVVDRFDDECAVDIVLSRSLFGTLADEQVPLQSLVVRDGTARVLATVPPNRSPSDAISAVKERHPAATFVGKRGTGIAAPFVTRTAFQALVDERLTGRQSDALQYAFEYGYFERPRRTSQQALADRMGISPSTFSQHLHAALRKLLTTLFSAGLTREASDDWDSE